MKVRAGIVFPVIAVVVAAVIAGVIVLLTRPTHSAAAAGPIKGVGGFCLDVSNGIEVNDADAEIDPCTTAETQQWRIGGDGTIRTGDYCLIDKDGSTGTETHARVAVCGSVKDASWRTWQVGSSGEIVSASSRLCLEVRKGLAKAGNAVWLDTCTGSPSQLWTASAGGPPVTVPSAGVSAPSGEPSAGSSASVSTVPPEVRGSTLYVSTATQLTAALARVKPGQTIQLANGTYSGKFNSTVSGTSSAPITIEGGRGAILNGGPLKSGYTFSLGTKDSAQIITNWNVEGFTVTGGEKGVIFDDVRSSVISGLYVHEIGEEGIHIRDNSSGDVIKGNTISYTGQAKQAYGEGIYVGSAVSNWGTYSQGKPDLSDNDKIIGNNISYTGAENIDIKEGTHGGLVEDNSFDGRGMCYNTTESCNSADSWVDVKGTAWTITGNRGTYEHAVWDSGSQSDDGFQDHVISTSGYTENSGLDNMFTNNTVSDVAGYGFYVVKSATGVVVGCKNKVMSAARGFSDIACK